MVPFNEFTSSMATVMVSPIVSPAKIPTPHLVSKA